MAITQYTQINNRSGLQRDLPQLSTAELGWSIDSRRLFIGNGTIEEGAPEVGNTELLTQYSDIFELAGAYTYKGSEAGYTVSSSPIFVQATWFASSNPPYLSVNENLGIAVGQLVIGPGLAPNTFVSSINDNTIYISESPLIDALSFTSIAFIGGSIITNGYWSTDYATSLTVSNATGIQTGMEITGPGIPNNLQVSAISPPANVSSICSSANANVNVNSAQLNSVSGIVVGSAVTSNVANAIVGGTYVTSIENNTVYFSTYTTGNIIGSSLTFSYQTVSVDNTLGIAPDAPVQIVFHSDTSRTLQEKLDDTVSVRDFGAVGDGETDDTAAINAALNQLYCVAPFNTAGASAPLTRRILLFPAGRYIVSSALLIPPNCTLSGEGLDHSIIEMVNSRTGDGTWANAATEISVTSNGSPSVQGLSVGMYVSGSGITSGSQIIDINTSTGNVTLNQAQSSVRTNEPLAFITPADYVARTASSRQETGSAIDATDGVNPQNILIRDMTFRNPRTIYVQDVFLVERANNVRFERVGFAGNGTTTSNTAGVSFNQSQAAYSVTYPTKNIEFDACRFNGISYGIFSDATSRNVSEVYATKCITVSNGSFTNLRQGILSNTDDYSWIIVNNTMDAVTQEGIRFASQNSQTFLVSGQMITTGHNIFLNVAGGDVPTNNIIYFYNRNCLSVGDMFARTDVQARTFARIYLNTQTSIAFQGTESIALGQRILNTSVTSPVGANVIANITIPAGVLLTGNSVSEIIFTDRGNGYLPNVIPAITIGPNTLPGANATATAVIGRQLDQANSEIVSGGSGWSGNVTIAFTPPTIIGAASIDTFYGSWSNGSGIITLEPTSPNVQIGATIAAQGMPLNIVAGNVSGNLVTAIYSSNGATVLTWLAGGNNLPVNFGYGILNGQGARTAVATVDVARSVTDFVVANIGRGYPENVSISVANTTLSNTSGQSFANCQANIIIKGFGLDVYQGNASNGTLSIGSGYSSNSVVTITFPEPQGGNSSQTVSVTGSWSNGNSVITLVDTYTGITVGGSITGTYIPADVVVGSVIYSLGGDIIYPVYSANSVPVSFANTQTSQALNIVRSISVANGYVTATGNGTVGYGVANCLVTNGGANYVSGNTYTVVFTSPTFTESGYPTLANAVLGFPIDTVTLTAGGNRYATMPEAQITPLLTGANTINADIGVFANVVSFAITQRGNGYSIGDILDIPANGAVAANSNARISVANIYASVSNIALNANGNAYTSVPTLTFAAPNIAGNTATGNTTAQVVSITAANRGVGYQANDLLTLVGGDGTNAQVQVNNTRIKTIALAANAASNAQYYGANLFVGNTVTLIGGSGNAASVTVTRLRISPYLLTNVAVAGTGYAVNETIYYGNSGNYSVPAELKITSTDANGGVTAFTFDDYGNFATNFYGDSGNIVVGGNAGGSGAIFNFTFGIQNFTVANTGNYVINTVATDVPGQVTGTVPTENPYFDVTYEINNFTLTNSGNFITTLPALSAVTTTSNSAAGTGATFDPGYGIRSIRLLNGGNGYYNANSPVVTIGGGGTAANVTATLNSQGWIANANLVFGGQYSAFPANKANTPLAANTVANTITQTAFVNATMGVQSLVILNAGQGYQTAPTISFTGFDAATSNATAVTTRANANGIVVGITVANSGTGYVSSPTFSVTGTNVTPAVGTTNLNTVGNLFFQLSNIGAGYCVPYDGVSANAILANVSVVQVSGSGSGAGILNISPAANSYSVITVGVAFDANTSTLYDGNGYVSPPVVIAEPNASPNITPAVIYSQLSGTGQLANLQFIDRGYGYTQLPNVAIATDGLVGINSTVAFSLETYGNVFLSGLLGGSGYGNAPNVTIGSPVSNLSTTATAYAIVGEYQQPLTIDTRANPGTMINYAVRLTDGGNVYSRSGILNITGGQTYDAALGGTTINVQSDDDFTENYESGFQLTVYNAPGNAIAVIGYDNTTANSTIGNGAGTMKFYIDQIVDNN
jgi:hypothetical protein